MSIKLFPHQQEALQKTAGCRNCAYYLDMGLGKTFVGSEKMMRYGNRVNLIVCQKSKIADWIEHMKQYHLIVCDLTKKASFEEFLEEAEDEYAVTPVVGIINYELTWRRPQLRSLQRFTLMLDESSLIQNSKAKQSKYILSLKPANVILLSGTPTAGRYENLWSQGHLLGWDITESLYNRQYVEWTSVDIGGITVPKVSGYKNVERLKQKLRDHGAVFMKTEDVFELPEQTFIRVQVDATPAYRKFQKNQYIRLNPETGKECKTGGIEMIGDSTFGKHLHLRQLCGIYSTAKLDAFQELVESTQDRLIVFYNFNLELDRLIERVGTRPVSIINGQTKDLTAYDEHDNSVTFIQYQAGAMGLNLQKANKIIYFTLTERSDLFEQSKARTHRIGQERPCFYYVMTVRNSVEEWIYKALEQRKDFTDDLFKEVYR